jgi:hypothetical protein
LDRRNPDYLFSHNLSRRPKLDGPTLLQKAFDAVRPRIEFQEWRCLQNVLPDRIQVLGCSQSCETVLARIAAHVANGHDIRIVSTNLRDSAVASRHANIHFTIHVSWTDNDSWFAESVEIDVRVSLQRRGRRWRAGAIEVVSISLPTPSTEMSESDAGSPDCDRVLVCAAATERRSGLGDLEKSCARMQIPLRVFGKGGQWRGFNHSKLKGLYWELEKHHHKYDYVLFTDAFDSLMVSSLDSILQKFLALDTPLLFSAEVNCFPSSPGQKAEDYPEAPTKYRFLNAGGFIGRVDYLLQLMREWNAVNSADSGIDQQWWAHLYLSGTTQIKLDYFCEIFQCLFMCEDDLEVRSSVIRNRITGSCPCVIHGNGGASLGPAADFILGRTQRRWTRLVKLGAKATAIFNPFASKATLGGT